MKTAIFITARTGSVRLPNKHFISVGDKPIMQYLIDRINKHFRNKIIYIVTGNQEKNKRFETFEDCQVFYGPDRNIPERHLEAALFYDAQRVVAVDGDDILCSPDAMSYVMGMLDRLDCCKTTGLPLGMNVFGYRVDYLQEAIQGLEGKIIETGWPRVFPAMTEIIMHSRTRPYLRFTLDYAQDLRFFEKVIKGLGSLIDKATDDQIIEYVLRSKAYTENENCAKEYMENFQKRMDSE